VGCVRFAHSQAFHAVVLSLSAFGCGTPSAEPTSAGGVGGQGGAAGSVAGAAPAGAPGEGGTTAGSGPASGAGGITGGTGNGGSAGSAGSALGGAGSGGGSSGTGAAGGAPAGAGGSGGDAGGSGGAGGAPMAGSGGAGSGGSAGVAGAMAGAAGSTAGAAGGPPIVLDPTLFIASDSTASTYGATTTQGGWGQFFADEFTDDVTVVNRSRGGRTARRFIDAEDEQSLDLVWNAAEAGDYLLVQFGTNDSNSTATYVNVDGDTIPYYLDPDTDFKTWLRIYIDGARERSLTPVLVTPPPRRSCTGDSHDFGNGTARWATAMKELAAETGTALIDLNQKTLDYLNMIGCIASEEFFFNDGTRIDGTHFSKTGAALMAGFVADGVAEAGLPVAALLK